MFNTGLYIFLSQQKLQPITTKDIPENYKVYLMLLICARLQASEAWELRVTFTLIFSLKCYLYFEMFLLIC